jgi:hypothetical protein
MALVNYSDSEDSGNEAPAAAPATKPTTSAKPKLINRTESKKIKVELPQIRPEPGQDCGRIQWLQQSASSPEENRTECAQAWRQPEDELGGCV